MDSQEALAFINKLLYEKTKQVLGKLEASLFLKIWEGEAYDKMVIDFDGKRQVYSPQHLKATGSELFKKIKGISNIEVKKNNFKESIEFIHKQYGAKVSSSQQPIAEPITLSQADESHSDYYLLQQNHNPFIPQNGRIEDPQQFFGREREIDRVFEVLKNGSSVALIAEEGMGKSSLLCAICQQAKNYLQSSRQPVFLDLNDGVHNEDEFYMALCDKIGIPESKGYSLTRNLRDKRVLLAIDNLGKFTWDGFTRQVRDQLRGLAEGSNAPLKLILAATEPLNNLFNDSQEQGNTSPLAGICQEEHIHPWNEATMHTFITNRLARTSVSFTEEEIIQLIQESGGHPRKVMQLCYQTYSRYVESLQ
ncbi:MAG: hypothetical protein V7K72_19830 [Nostoc sp.]|uniref:nSTAND1 domain-containing NTPase n=1 Tax=Nostoc sp. TaxID=1180 RepID=UPI002FF56081